MRFPSRNLLFIESTENGRISDYPLPDRDTAHLGSALPKPFFSFGPCAFFARSSIATSRGCPSGDGRKLGIDNRRSIAALDSSLSVVNTAGFGDGELSRDSRTGSTDLKSWNLRSATHIKQSPEASKHTCCNQFCFFFRLRRRFRRSHLSRFP